TQHIDATKIKKQGWKEVEIRTRFQKKHVDGLFAPPLSQRPTIWTCLSHMHLFESVMVYVKVTHRRCIYNLKPQKAIDVTICYIERDVKIYYGPEINKKRQ
ncbi:unnamed protein product, partial [Owenia fusiformis]